MNDSIPRTDEVWVALITGAKEAEWFISRLRIPQDRWEAQEQVVAGNRVLEKLRQAMILVEKEEKRQ